SSISGGRGSSCRSFARRFRRGVSHKVSSTCETRCFTGGSSSMNPEDKEQLLDMIRTGGRRYQSCRACGIEPEAFDVAMMSDRQFARDVLQAESEADEEIEDALRQAALAGNVAAAVKWLQSRIPDRWGADQKSQTVHNHLQLSPEERKSIIARLVEAKRIEDAK